MTFALILIVVGVLLGWISGDTSIAKTVRESALRTMDDMF